MSPLTAPNACAPTTVAILFADPVVTELFSELLDACGATPRIVQSVSSIPANARVVTEPQFYKALPRAYRRTCLLVGDTRSTGHNRALCLSQPLTEEKIEAALQTLLSARS